MAQAADRDAAQALFHARLRWMGAPLLLSGVCLLGWSIVVVAQGASVVSFFLGLFGTGLGLATFGANHDTAMALALRAQDAGEDNGSNLSEHLVEELAEEMAHDRAELLSLRPSPKIATVLPLVAMMVQGFVLWRLTNGVL